MLFLLSAIVVASAQSTDDAYIRIYESLQQADALNQSGKYRQAAEKYLEVQTALKRFKQNNPNWNNRIIDYRLSYTTERLESLVKFLTAPAPEQPANQAAPSANFQLSSRRNPMAEEQQKKIDSLNLEVRRLESEKTNLEAKLKEALSVQPAAVDPVQLSRAQKKLTDLEKERDLLKVALEQERARAAKLEQGPRPDPQAVKQLEGERDELKRQLAQALAQRDDAESRYQQRIHLAQSKLKQLDELQKERDDLDKKLKIAQARASVESERKPSKAELKELNKVQAEKEAAEKKFYSVAKELSDLQSEREKELKAHQVALARIRQLEEERDSLQTKLTAVTTVAAKGGSVDSLVTLQMATELEKLRARVAALEAKPAPFTPEELALFKKPGGSTASAFYLATRPSTKDLSPGVQKVIDEADHAFAEQRFEDAASKYQQVLSKNDKNVYTLANLASAQIEMNKLEDAEHNLKRALIVAPDDPFSLLLLGKVKMNENKMDEALDALSRAAQLNPDSAETQNYLGIVLSEKGQRTGAEAALRRAIQIQPDYASAHHNLAIIYATQKPPFLELARWHYEKAVSLGHVKNPDLEKIVAGK